MTPSSFILIPGAGGDAMDWYRVVPLLRDAGHEAVAIPLPAGEEGVGLAEYADAIVAAMGGRDDLVLVAQSMGAYSAPMAAARGGVSRIVLVAQPWPLERWPDVPTRVIAGARDRLFPLSSMRALARDRLGLDEVTVIDSGHLPALSRPEELARAILEP